MNWQLFVSSASAIISLESIVMNVWWPHHNRRQADWCMTKIIPKNRSFIKSELYKVLFNGDPDIVYTVPNTGDGPAFVVKLKANGCKSEFLQLKNINEGIATLSPDTINSVQPGDHFYIRIWNEQNSINETVALH